MNFNENQYAKLLTIGYNKNRTITLTAIKEEAIRKKHRFRKNFMPSVKYAQLENLQEDLLLSDHGNVVIEMSHSDKPLWMKEHEEVTALIDNIEKSFKQQTKLINEQKIKLFSTDASYDQQINQNFETGTRLLDQTQIRINNMTRFSHSLNSANDEIILSNAQKGLSLRLKEIKDNFTKQKRSYEESKKPVPSAFDNCERLDQDEDESVQAQEALISNFRSEEINKLSKTMTGLATVFQQMQQLVIEQDQIVINIDSNLENAERHVQKGRDKLKDANKVMRSKCGDNVIKLLITLIIIFSFLLVLKFAKY